MLKLIKKPFEAISRKIRLFKRNRFEKKYISTEYHSQSLKRCPCCKKSAPDLFKTINNYYEEQNIIENDIYCTNCKTIVAHWAYGSLSFISSDLKPKIESNEECPF